MPRRIVLTAQDRSSLFEMPVDRASLVRHYTFNEEEMDWIRACRGDLNQLGFAVHLALMKYPCRMLELSEAPSPELLAYLGEQLDVHPSRYGDYALRAETRREHLARLQVLLGLRPYNDRLDRQAALVCLQDLTLRTDRGFAVAEALVGHLRSWNMILPSADVLESVCAEAITNGERRLYQTLTGSLTAGQKAELEKLVEIWPHRGMTGITWLKQSYIKASPANILSHIERLIYIKGLGIPATVRRNVHEDRLRKLARLCEKASVQRLRRLEPKRRLATLVAFILESMARIIDEALQLHDHMIGQVHQTANRRFEKQFLASAKSIKHKVALLAHLVRILRECKRKKQDPFAAIAKFISWEELERQADESDLFTEYAKLDALPLVKEGYWKIHRYAGPLLEAIELRAAPAAKDIYDGVMAVKRIHRENVNPHELPIEFIDKKWRPLVFSGEGIDLEYYELCAMSELRSGLRSGDLSVVGSRLFKDFEEYLIPLDQFESIKNAKGLPVSIEPNCAKYLKDRLDVLKSELFRVNELARKDALIDVELGGKSGLKIAKLENAEPPEAELLGRELYARVPRVKITDVLLDIEQWTGLSRHFTHEKTGLPPADRQLLLTVLLAEGINIGLTRMADACPGTTYDRLEHMRSWHVRPEAYAAALATIVNAQRKVPIAALWGDGSTSSSDGQHFPTAGHGYDSGTFNAHYGSEPVVVFYTHISDQFSPYNIKVICVSLHEAPHVLDGLLYHESELQIKEHYTDTGGFSDHVFALMRLLGFVFAPRIRDLAEKRLHVPAELSGIEMLKPLTRESLNIPLIESQWDNILRLATSIRHGTVMPSVILRKLGSYPRQNRLAVALREFGRIERTLHMLKWMSEPEFRRRVQLGLNKGEAAHTLARAVGANRSGEIRDRTLEGQMHRANGINLLVAAISYWNTMYLDQVVRHRGRQGQPPNPQILRHVSPLAWQHIALTGDYVWRPREVVSEDGFRALREIDSFGRFNSPGP